MGKTWLVFGIALALLANLFGFVLMVGNFDPIFQQYGFFALFGGQALLAFLLGWPLLFGWTPHARVAGRVRPGLLLGMLFIVLFLVLGIALAWGALGTSIYVLIALAVVLTILVIAWLAMLIAAIVL